jgi:NAD(P)-dependent dehydrogenase (short-subunit alcohol dehydrogenase family)
VATESGTLDIAVNAVGLLHVQGKPLLELSLDEFVAPIAGYARAHFAIGKAAATQFVKQQSGVLITLSTPGATRAYEGVLGFAMACAAIECFTRQLACELGAAGARVVCLRPDFMPETLERGSHARVVFGEVARRLGLSFDEMLARTPAGQDALLKRPAKLDEIARTAAFVASPGAGALTATTINVSCGSVVG